MGNFQDAPQLVQGRNLDIRPQELTQQSSLVAEGHQLVLAKYAKPDACDLEQGGGHAGYQALPPEVVGSRNKAVLIVTYGSSMTYRIWIVGISCAQEPSYTNERA
jgi:hypothetical protein